MKVRIKEIPDTNWVQGKCGKCTFEAKVFDERSKYGINEGRVSKLTIYDKNNSWLANYDRDWDIEPEGEIVDLYANTMETLETLPKRYS